MFGAEEVKWRDVLQQAWAVAPDDGLSVGGEALREAEGGFGPDDVLPESVDFHVSDMVRGGGSLADVVRLGRSWRMSD